MEEKPHALAPGDNIRAYPPKTDHLVWGFKEFDDFVNKEGSRNPRKTKEPVKD